MLALKRDVLLADEPGLGKTAEVAEYINRTAPEACASLVVCPAALRLNWRRELSRWCRSADFARGVAILSYEGAVAAAERLASVRWQLIVFDEAHYLKNPKAKRTRVCLRLKSVRRLFLTGTPVVNRPLDLYPMLRSMGCRMTLVEYGRRFCAGHLVQVRRHPPKYVWDFSGASRLDVLSSQLRRTCMVRRTKAEVLPELPVKIRTVVDLEVPGVEPETLRLAAVRYFDSLQAADAAADRLFQVVFAEYSKVRLEQARKKLPLAEDFLRNLLEEEQKIVVFAWHREIVQELAAALGGFHPAAILGGQSETERDRLVQAFQNDPSTRLLLGQLLAAGTGLTFTAAHTVVFVEEDWVPGNLVQAEDRCHRLGQDEPVRIFYLVLRDSVDASMVRAIVKKQEIIEELMQ